MKFSIIIPAYNLEEYLAGCLLSIKQQSLNDFEVLIVDDGSTDGTGQIAQEFVDQDCRFKLISKENGGVSSARNLGLEYAVGEYIWFIDGDDYIHPDSLAYLNKIFLIYPDADYVTFHYSEVNACYTKSIKFDSDLSLAEVACFETDNLEGFVAAFHSSPRGACLTCYRSNVINGEKYGSYRLGEDTLFAKEILFKARKVVSSKASIYFYYVRAESASRKPQLIKVIDYLNICKKLNRFKGKKNNWADDSLMLFCFELGLVEGMVRLQSLSDVNERHTAFGAWLSNASVFLNVFNKSAKQKWVIRFLCWSSSYRLSWFFFYFRYAPRRLISANKKMVKLLKLIKIIPCGD